MSRKDDAGEPTSWEFASWTGYWEFVVEVRDDRRYVWSPKVQAFLDGVRRTMAPRTFRIEKGQPLYRAQLGLGRDECVAEDGTFYEPIALCAKRMKPRRGRGNQGRANAQGMPVLYLAAEQATAIAEIRPWLGADVSVALLRTTRELRALDLTRGHGESSLPPFDATEGRFVADAENTVRSVWTEIDNAFSRPVSPSDELAEYVPTQILAELFRTEGYDAIVYRSQLAEDGYNVVLFDPDDADVVSGTPFDVKSIKVNAEQSGNTWYRPPKEADAEPAAR